MQETRLRVGVLGSTLVEVNGLAMELGSLKQRALLAVLTLAEGRPVSADRIIEALWGDRPPAGVVTTVHGYIAALRRILEPHRRPRTPAAVLVTTPAGYALRLAADGTDAAQLSGVVAETARVLDRMPDPLRPSCTAADRPQLTDILHRLTEALQTWRGLPYADLADCHHSIGERQRLDEVKLTAQVQRVVIILAIGDNGRAAAELDGLIAEHRLREQLWVLRAVALARDGRQAQALDGLQDLREVLAEELGIDPSPAVRQLQADILRQENGTATPVPATPPASAIRRFPRPLTGRDTELGILVDALPRAAKGWTQLIRVTGEEGIGKTRLVQELADRAVDTGFRTIEIRCSADAGAPDLWPIHRMLDHPACGRAEVTLPTDLNCPKARFLFAESVGTALRAAAAAGPLLVVVEDLHRADPRTLGVLGHLAAHCPDLSLVLCVTQRPAPTDGPWGELEDTFTRSGATTVSMGPDTSATADLERPGTWAAGDPDARPDPALPAVVTTAGSSSVAVGVSPALPMQYPGRRSAYSTTGSRSVGSRPVGRPFPVDVQFRVS